jgi:polyisoprenyl-phosphate glycosyltransferase
MISVVVPVYGCQAALCELTSRVFAAIESLSETAEIILVNDASPDDSWSCIQRLAAADQRIKGICLSRNFGQHAAITAGLHYAQGDYVAVMDCDLQDVPEELPKLYRALQNGYDAAFGVRRNRKDGLVKRLASKAFSLTLRTLTGRPQNSDVANYSVIRAQVVKQIGQLPERHRSYGLMVTLATDRIGYVEIEHSARVHGKSSYNLRRQLTLATDIIVSHSTRPLYISVVVGFLAAAISLVGILILAVRALVNGSAVAGWASTICSIWLATGLLLINLGVVGLYLGRVLEQVKGRPLFFVREELNISERETVYAPRDIARG